jgi:hypothetical protein
MSAKWRRCAKCRKVLAAEEFDEGSDICRADLVKATPKPAASRSTATVTTRVVAPQPAAPGGLPGLRGRGDTEVRARRARVRALERLAEQYADDFEHFLREERVAEGL